MGLFSEDAESQRLTATAPITCVDVLQIQESEQSQSAVFKGEQTLLSEHFKDKKAMNQFEHGKDHATLNSNKSLNKGITRYVDSRDETLINFDISNMSKTDI